ncbi:DASS family sodium-coupled anion symporter [Moraxella haemolytica]|uniref:SLC13 family permease n=1 Tax=Moraxella haemolytica TaxID=2904119 RepID=UPI002543387D|nr:DASS family sodium-coupled anion symporter [Moraxella sp. ZY171148]WII95447.1 DASS family sodium-coupled anion symporter [Moraxella sp. ZY171148]
MAQKNETLYQGGFAKTPKKIYRGIGIISIAAVVAYLLYAVILPFDANANKGLAILFFIGVLWLTEAVHITATALFVPVLAVLAGVPEFNTKSAFANFADPIIYVFVGGFALAAALSVQKLDRKIALWIMRLSNGHLGRAVMMMFLATAGLSMWISNTATAAMMVPLSLGLLTQLDREKDRNTCIFILLGVAYSAGIGGIGLLVGSPPNGIAAKQLGMDFMDWLKVALPLLVVLLPTLIATMYLILKPNLNQKIVVSDEEIPWTPARILTIVVFVITATCWIFGKQISGYFGFDSPDTMIGMMGALSVMVLGLATWKQVSERTEWGVLLLIGGGFTLSNVMKHSGASAVLGEQLATHLAGMPVIFIIFVTACFMIFLTEFTSNTGSTALMVPIFASVATQLGLPNELLVMVIAIGASCAFMMPVAAPPNGIAFATGYMAQKEMVKVGFFLNWVAIGIVTLWAYVLLI